jgi:hypothetical protein
MAIRMEIFDGVTPMLDVIASTSYTLAREALTKTGLDTKDEVKNAIRHYKHNWHHAVIARNQIPKGATGVKSGNRNKTPLNKNTKSRYIWKDMGKVRTLGTMTSHGSASGSMVDNVGDMITSYISPKGGLSVTVGGSHKRAIIKKYKDGEENGDYGEVHAVSAETKAIFHKLNTGQISKDHPYYTRVGKSGYETRHTMYDKTRNFFDLGRSFAKAEVERKLTKYYSQVLPRVVNNKNIKLKEINTRIA